jgi:hypothetical protein
MTSDFDKGRHLEQDIAAFLRQHGYAVSTNVRVRGRSGAIHELDVVGDKSDGLTSFRLVVECKSWTTAIDKAVVYKLAAELADLGAARGVIVTPSGWTVQAAQAAAQANIELWGPDELVTRLGACAGREVHASWQGVAVMGMDFTIAADVAKETLRRAARGKLGLAGDEMVWFGQLWLPVWLLQWAVTRLEGAFRKVHRVTRIWNTYEGLDGQLLSSAVARPELANVDVSSGYLSPLVKTAEVEATTRKAIGQWHTVRSEPAKRNHARSLARAGFKVPVNAISVESTTLTYYPLWIAFLRKGPRERIATVDATTGREWVGLGQRLTAHVQLVRESLTPK